MEVTEQNISYPMINEESRRVLSLLDEIRLSQELVEARLNEANDSTVADLGHLKQIVGISFFFLIILFIINDV
uniref:t-SNARE coiled-coil homology domain-containing protein n=1 Tax=Heterorhabditis bacteriophora TaxID=37862 RepID=A0A1I7XHC1_HETBA